MYTNKVILFLWLVACRFKCQVIHKVYNAKPNSVLYGEIILIQHNKV